MMRTAALRGMDGRSLRLGGNAAAGAFARLAALVSLVLATPLVLASLGLEQFGLWAVAGTLTLGYSLFDLGLGLALVGRVAEAHGRGDTRAAARAAATALPGLTLAGAAMAAAIWLGLPAAATHLPAAGQEALAQLRGMLPWIACAIGLTLPLSLVERVQSGTGQEWIAQAWRGAGHLATLGWMAACSWAGLGLGAFVLGLFVPLSAALALNAAWFFLGPGRALAPWNERLDWAEARALLAAGGAFAALHGALALAWRGNAAIVLLRLGPEAAGLFGLLERLTALVFVPLAVALAPAWPLARAALAGADGAWVRRVMPRLGLAMAAFGAVGGVALVAMYRPLTALWLGETLAVAPALVALAVGWRLCEIATAWLSSLMTAQGEILRQAAWIGMAGAAGLAAKLVLVPLGIGWIYLVSALTVAAGFLLPGALHALPRMRAAP
jgi:O-antigen/teichoic acid export membrane protein